MKKLLFILSIFSFSLIDAQSPVFYGMTVQGGSFGEGAIISFYPGTNVEYTLHSFKLGDGYEPFGNLTYDKTNGLFYGMTEYGGGGSIADGTIISFDPSSDAEVVVHSFGIGTYDGKIPMGSLVYYSSNGLFYGMTSGSGIGEGAIISFNPITNIEDTVHCFGLSGEDGKLPYGNLVYYPGNGLFYGMTSEGGKYGDGAIISFNPTTNKEDTAYSFGRGEDGQAPHGSLVYYSGNGLLYGMTSAGGSLNWGTIISFNPYTNIEEIAYNFRGYDGGSAYGNLAYCPGNGLFYGMTNLGGIHNKGAIISFNPATNAEDTGYCFWQAAYGQLPYGSLVYYPANGLFYGMTNVGGSLNVGAIISFNPITNAEDTVHSFGRGTDGKSPYGDLVIYPASAGINKIIESSEVNVYPNPSNGKFTIVIANEVTQSQIEIYNILGERVFDETLRSGQGDNSIDISSKPNGVYFYRVLKETGELIGSGKLVIEK